MKNLKILIIDDETALLEMYRIKFEKEGFEVFLEDNSVNSVETAKKILPDVILLDLMMPRVNGFEVLAAIRTQIGGNVTIIVISNLGEHERKKAIETGADEFLLKSNYTPGEVLVHAKQIYEKKKNTL